MDSTNYKFSGYEEGMPLNTAGEGNRQTHTGEIPSLPLSRLAIQLWYEGEPEGMEWSYNPKYEDNEMFHHALRGMLANRESLPKVTALIEQCVVKAEVPGVIRFV